MLSSNKFNKFHFYNNGEKKAQQDTMAFFRNIPNLLEMRQEKKTTEKK